MSWIERDRVRGREIKRKRTEIGGVTARESIILTYHKSYRGDCAATCSPVCAATCSPVKDQSSTYWATYPQVSLSFSNLLILHYYILFCSILYIVLHYNILYYTKLHYCSIIEVMVVGLGVLSSAHSFILISYYVHPTPQILWPKLFPLFLASKDMCTCK